jgi:serine/threonine protein phosphatase PrpC
MSEIKLYIQNLLTGKGQPVQPNRSNLFESFSNEAELGEAVTKIFEYQNMIIDKWKLKNRVEDVVQQQLLLPNATVGKQYDAIIDFKKLGWDDLVAFEIEGLEDIGLTYDNTKDLITGVPSKSGDVKLDIKFRVEGEDEKSILNIKKISFVINPDPKSLWKDIASDKEDKYWKEDNISLCENLGDKKILVSSKRGRSHANVGSFRDDDFAFKHFEKTGWSIIAVADGAGSAKISRQGSKIACNEVIDYFSENFTEYSIIEFDNLLKEHKEGTGEDTQKKLNHFVYNNLGKAALSVHKKLDNFAKEIECPLKDLHSTLIFALVKKYEFGYAILTFGVGDCPIGLVNKDLTEITLMNWLDVGEFGGGTRFITMPEIFNSDKFSTRFGFKLIEDFSFLMLMTDGIYDPKFIVEANLEKIDNWNEFINDLKGENADKISVDFNYDNKEIANELSTWMDFWSAGNHDDRTLAIVF